MIDPVLQTGCFQSVWRIFFLLFLSIYDIKIKVIGYERENNEFASVREGRSLAVSRPAVCHLVRPGAAMETWPDALRYRGFKCVPFGANLGGTAEAFTFRPNVWDGRFFYFLAYPDTGDILMKKCALWVLFCCYCC